MEKKLISLVLAILMMVSILPMSAFAADSLPESEHPYADNVKQRWTYKGKEDTAALAIRFSEETELEQDYDFIYIYDGDGKPLYRYTGTELSGETIYLNSNGFTLVLETDASNTSYGFKIEDIKEIDSATYSLGVIGDVYCDVTADYETRTITLSPSAKNDGTHPLNFDIVKNVYWVNHVVINDGFVGELPNLNCFKFADRFDICDGVYFNRSNIYETEFYGNSSNWENGGLYIDNYLVDMNRGTSVKNGTKYICDGALDGECVIIPDSVTYIGGDNLPSYVFCTVDSYARSWAADNAVPFNAEEVKVKFKSPIINSGTPLSSAIEVYKLTDNYEWESVGSNYSASGYKANQIGVQTVTIKTGGYSSTVTIGISSSDEQYINFSDPVLYSSLINNDVDSNSDGIVSVDEMQAYNGYISLAGVSDVSGLEYASLNAEIDCYNCTALAKDILALQSYSKITMLENAKRRIDTYGRFGMGDYRLNLNYSSSNPDVAEVVHGEYQDMICTGKSGTATITVTCEDVSCTFDVAVESPNKPMGEKTDSVPELLSKYSYNADGNFYMGSQRLRFDSKVLMRTFYPARNHYYGTYYLTEDGTLWTLNEGARFPRKISTGFVKITSAEGYIGVGLALDKNGDCWNLNDSERIAKNVKDINGMFFLTNDDELYRCYNYSYEDDFDSYKNVLVSSDVKSIVKTDENGTCLYNKNDGSTYYAYTDPWYYFNIEFESKMISSDKLATDIMAYISSYFYLDEDQVLWELSSDGVSNRVADNIVQLNTEECSFLDKDGNLYSVMDLTCENGEYKLGKPLLTNVKKISDRFYLDKDNNLYTSIYDYGRTICWGIRMGEKPVKIMTNVADFTECDYLSVIITRTDGSVWTWKKSDNADYYNNLLEACSERGKIITDEKTGIEIEFKNQFDKTVKLEANEISDTNTVKILNDKFGEVEAKIYDVSVKNNGVTVQPNGSVTVSIPFPETFSPYIALCYIDTDDESIITIDRSVGGGYVTFTTEHLGRFAIVQEVKAELGDVNADGVINSVDALQVLQHSVSLIQLQGDEAKRADVNKDKMINSNDALNILRYSVGLITDFSEIK